MSSATARALDASVASALINNFCDRAEHNETVERDWVLQAGAIFRRLAFEIAAEHELDIFSAYAARIDQIEHRNVLIADVLVPGPAENPDLGALVRAASTWRELQLIQVQHDRRFHPDVFGLSRADQLRHYAFHAAKLAGALARDARGELPHEEAARRVPDLLLFGIKLATVMSDKLPAAPRGELI